MNTLIQRVTIGYAWVVLLLAGCATTTHQISKPMPLSVPGIAVVIDCGKCEVRSTVPDLIRAEYAESAAKAGVVIADDVPLMTVTIKEYTDRGLAMRAVSMLAGPLAFALKDEMKAIAVVDGKPVSLEYAYRIPFWGIEAVAKKLGEMSFKAVTVGSSRSPT